MIAADALPAPRPDGLVAGPFLYLRHCAPGRLALTAIAAAPEAADTGPLAPDGAAPAAPEALDRRCGLTLWRWRFDLPAGPGAGYRLAGARYPVAAAHDGDLRLAYVSCNGMERGDLDRPGDARNAMWLRLAERHRESPFHLLLAGGDQIYGDRITRLHPLSEGWPDRHRDPATPEEVRALDEALRDGFFRRYLAVLSQPGTAYLSARVPALCMWDDHDICDGWGSLPGAATDSEVGRLLYRAARDNFLMFQFGCAPDERPEPCLDPMGETLGWALDLPDLRILAPDLRSERQPDRIMGPRGWATTRRALETTDAPRVLLLSSTPLLGPRLSLVERLMKLTPWMEEYEDDLRDQWQSYAHRAEWCEMLGAVLRLHEATGAGVTLLSGEIHLATRATLASPSGPVHQLVASGISHPPPAAWHARLLGWLATLGEAPLKEHPIRLHPLPGQRRIYTAQRNSLLLERRDGRWSASWDLEESGLTEPLAI